MTADSFAPWPAIGDPARIADLEAALTAATARAEAAEAEAARLTRELCSIAMHSRDGRAGLPLLWRAVLGGGMPWGGVAS